MNNTKLNPASGAARTAGSQQRMVSSRRTIELGPLARPMAQQLAGLKHPIKKENLQLLERMSLSVSLLYMQGIISDSEYNRGGKRLIQRIQKEVDKAANERTR